MKSCANCPLRRICPGACRSEQEAHASSGLVRAALRGKSAPFWTRIGRELADNAGNRRAVILALIA